jgi:hypothetical protein
MYRVVTKIIFDSKIEDKIPPMFLTFLERNSGMDVETEKNIINM